MSSSVRNKKKVKKKNTASGLRQIQGLMAHAVMRPLTAGQQMKRRWDDGQPTGKVVSTIIKPNDRLTAFQRLEIYNKQYWFRVIDCFYDDYPGLRAILGDEKFHRLTLAYLKRCPSRSYTLRNLGSRLVWFLEQEPRWVRPHIQMAMDMARFEWAQIVAFDSAQEPRLTTDDLLGRDPAGVRLRLQPYVNLLQMDYPLDKFIIAVKKGGVLREESSNAAEEQSPKSKTRRVALPKPKKTWLAVHRHENSLYYKRLEPEAYEVLSKLRDGATLGGAVAGSFADDVDTVALAQRIRQWFENWMTLGWFCKEERL